MNKLIWNRAYVSVSRLNTQETYVWNTGVSRFNAMSMCARRQVVGALRCGSSVAAIADALRIKYPLQATNRLSRSDLNYVVLALKAALIIPPEHRGKAKYVAVRVKANRPRRVVNLLR